MNTEQTQLTKKERRDLKRQNKEAERKRQLRKDRKSVV